MSEDSIRDYEYSENKKAITVSIKTVYGRDIIYPVCDDAKLFCNLVNQTSLTQVNIDIIKQLGYTVFVQPSKPTTL